MRTIDELKAENTKLQLFINVAANELKTPIMPIVEYSEMLMEDLGEEWKPRVLSTTQKDWSNLQEGNIAISSNEIKSELQKKFKSALLILAMAYLKQCYQSCSQNLFQRTLEALV